MKNREFIKQELNLKYPLWGYSPKGVTDPCLSLELSKAGAVGLMDLEGLNDEEIRGIIKRFHHELPCGTLWGVRISDEEQLNILYDFSMPLIIVPFFIDEKTEKKIRKISRFIVSEVFTVEEAEEKSCRSDLFLVKGQEAGGRVGEKSTFILLQEFYKSSYPFVIQGGFGLFNISGAMTCGAISVVSDSQLYLFPECPLSEDMKKYLKSLQESDNYLAGETCNYKFRLSGKIASKSIKDIKNLEKEYLSCGEDMWEKALRDYIKSNKFFNDGKDSLIPLGHDLSFAPYLYSRFKNLKTYLEGINNTLKNQRENNYWPFSEENELSKEFNLKFPLFQGPMANISDNPAFAEEISSKGAFPVIALGHMTEKEAEKVILSFEEKLKDRYPYGCGIIGLSVNQERYEEHLKLIEKYRPDAVWIAGGSVELAGRIKKLNIPVFLHTPFAEIFKSALTNDIYAMILEGNECGGHTGILSSFVLWESVLEYLDTIRNDLKKKVKILFAGGLGTSISSAILASIISLHKDIIAPAIQLGTSYMFTKEIIETGSLSDVFQELLLSNKDTKITGSTVNLRARVLPTACAYKTLDKEIERIKDGLSLTERKKLYEGDNIGSLRIAVKGSPDRKEQIETGSFMAGEIISMYDRILTVLQLHNDLIDGGRKILINAGKEEIMDRKYINVKDKIAITGMGCIFPDALNIQEFWKNILEKKYSITEVPPERWDEKIYYDPDRNVPDKTYSKIGGFVRGFQFNSVKYKIPPSISKSMDVIQKWAVEAAGQALYDAGIKTDGKERQNISVIIANCLSGDLMKLTNRRVWVHEICEHIRTSASGLSEELKENLVKKVTDLYLSQSPEITEDTLPGELPNVIAGRVANVFNLTGKSMAVDAACAGSLAALDTAVKGLMVKDYDTALVGAVEGVMDPASYTKFCKIGAISAKGSRPFDMEADGFVMSEGCGFIVIKRLEDAIKEGDKIYAVLSATGSSTDGKGKGITAPNPKGQKQAIMMAIEKSGIDLSEIQHIEAHGTSTKIGDIAELQVLADIFTDVKEKFAVTSVKSQIGHLKSAAGMAGIIKSALSLYNRILPPSINFEEPNSKIDWEKVPFYINTDIKEWKRFNNSTRKCGVSAFGFGGTNYHAILEEYDPKSFIYKSFCEEKKSEEKYFTGSQKREEKKLTFMFSGQGSQYVGMIKELYESSDEVKNTVEEAERICLSFGKFSVKEKLFGKDGMTKEEAEKALRETKYTQPCLYTVEMALYRFLKEKGIVPHMVSGHSSGEYSALAASGVLSFEDGLKAMISRGTFMSETQKIFKGTMAAVRACGTIVEEVISSIEDEYVTVANYNSPEETVISGTVDGIEKAVELLKEKGFSALKLNVSTAFHSELMDRAVSKMNEFLDSITFRKPQIPVYSNVTGSKYPDNPEEIRNILKNQIKSPVLWMEIIKNIYNDGGRVFVEIGPKKALFNFVSSILKYSADIASFYTIHPKEREYERLEKLCPEIIKAMGEKQEKREGVKSAFRILEDDDEIRDLMNKPCFEAYLEEHRELIKLFFVHGYKLFEDRWEFVKSGRDFNHVKECTNPVAALHNENPIPEILPVKIEEISQKRPVMAEKDITVSEKVMTKLKEIISDISGYPVEDLLEEFKLEEELGIDSLKQAEIIGEARRAFDLPFDETLDISDYPAIKDIALYIDKRLIEEKSPGKEMKNVSSASEKVMTKLKEIISDISGYPVEDLQEEFKLEEELGIDSLKQAEIIGEARRAFDLPFDETLDISDYPAIKDIALYIEKRFSEEKLPEKLMESEKNLLPEKSVGHSIKIRKIMSLPCSAKNINQINLSEEKFLIIHSGFSDKITGELEKRNIKYRSFHIDNTEAINKSDYTFILLIVPENTDPFSETDREYFEKLFNLFKALKLQEKLKIFAISEGNFDTPPSPLSSGITGFLRTINKEYDITIKHIYSSHMEEIFRELSYNGNITEISFKEEIPYSMALSDELIWEDSAGHIKYSSDEIVFVTGGARGITFESIKDLFAGKDSPVIVISGRTPLPDNHEEFISFSEDDWKNIKEKIKEDLKNKYEKVTPLMVEKEWQKYLKQAEVAKNIKYLRDRGLTVKYFSADITNKERITEIIETVKKEFNLPVTAIIHGAGIEESKAFRAKKIEKAREIVSVKIDGLLNILKFIPSEPLKRIICFSSIAGRFGNNGQIDYSFANGYLSGLCLWLNRKFEHIKTLSVDWSAWEGKGMAEDGKSLDMLRQRGVEPVPVETGKAIFRKLFYSDISGEVIVSGKLGDFDKDGLFDKTVSEYPLIDEFKREDTFFTGYRKLTKERDIHIVDHIYREVSLLPGVMGLEAGAELYKMAENREARELSYVEFKSALKFLNTDEKDMKVIYNPSEKSVRINSLFSAVNQKKIEKEHFAFKISESDGMCHNFWLPSFDLPFMSREDIYDFFGKNRFLFGESFRVLDRLVYIDGETIITKVKIPEKSLFRENLYKLHINPLAIEAAFQSASLFCSLIKSTINLPSKVEKIRIYSESNPEYVFARFKRYEDNHKYFDLYVTDRHREVIIVIEELGVIDSDKVLYRNESVQELDKYLAMYESLRDTGDIYLIDMKYVDRLISLEEDKFYGRLKDAEKDNLDKITNKKRKIEYLAGVIAAKNLYERKVMRCGEVNHLEIRKAGNGMPYYYDEGKKISLFLSISHSGDYALAVLDEMPVGVDIQKIEELSEGFYMEAFSEKERDMIGSDRELAVKVWSVKEAVIKIAGFIEKLKLKNIEVEFTERGEFRVSDGFSLKSKMIGNYVVSYCQNLGDGGVKC